MIARLTSHKVTRLLLAKLLTLAYYQTTTVPDDLAKSLAGNNLMLVQEVDEEKVEDPLTGLSGNSSDLSDSEKSSSMQDLKMKWAGDLTRSLSARRQRSGSRLDHPS